MIPDMVSCRTVLINRERVGNDIDLFVQGDCDDCTRNIARALGWEDELDEQHVAFATAIKSKKQQKNNTIESTAVEVAAATKETE
jgi:hypothetical protein